MHRHRRAQKVNVAALEIRERPRELADDTGGSDPARASPSLMPSFRMQKFHIDEHACSTSSVLRSSSARYTISVACHACPFAMCERRRASSSSFDSSPSICMPWCQHGLFEAPERHHLRANEHAITSRGLLRAKRAPEANGAARATHCDRGLGLRALISQRAVRSEDNLEIISSRTACAPPAPPSFRRSRQPSCAPAFAMRLVRAVAPASAVDRYGMPARACGVRSSRRRPALPPRQHAAYVALLPMGSASPSPLPEIDILSGILTAHRSGIVQSVGIDGTRAGFLRSDCASGRSGRELGSAVPTRGLAAHRRNARPRPATE